MTHKENFLPNFRQSCTKRDRDFIVGNNILNHSKIHGSRLAFQEFFGFS